MPVLPRIPRTSKTKLKPRRLVTVRARPLLPGSVYDEPGHVRIGFGRANLPEALELFEANFAGPG